MFCHQCGMKNDENNWRCVSCNAVLYHESASEDQKLPNLVHQEKNESADQVVTQSVSLQEDELVRQDVQLGDRLAQLTDKSAPSAADSPVMSGSQTPKSRQAEPDSAQQQVRKTVICPNCGKENLDSIRRCIICSEILHPAVSQGRPPMPDSPHQCEQERLGDLPPALPFHGTQNRLITRIKHTPPPCQLGFILYVIASVFQFADYVSRNGVYFDHGGDSRTAPWIWTSNLLLGLALSYGLLIQSRIAFFLVIARVSYSVLNGLEYSLNPWHSFTQDETAFSMYCVLYVVLGILTTVLVSVGWRDFFRQSDALKKRGEGKVILTKDEIAFAPYTISVILSAYFAAALLRFIVDCYNRVYNPAFWFQIFNYGTPVPILILVFLVKLLVGIYVLFGSRASFYMMLLVTSLSPILTAGLAEVTIADYFYWVLSMATIVLLSMSHRYFFREKEANDQIKLFASMESSMKLIAGYFRGGRN